MPTAVALALVMLCATCAASGQAASAPAQTETLEYTGWHAN